MYSFLYLVKRNKLIFSVYIVLLKSVLIEKTFKQFNFD